MYDFITTRSKPGTAKSGNSSTPIWTIFCWRFKLTMFTRMWKTANISMTQAVFPKIIHFTAQQTKRFWARWKTRWTERQLLSVFALGQKFTQSRQRSKTSKSRKARKRMLWKKRQGMCITKRCFSAKNHKLNMLHIEGHEIYGVRVNKISLIYKISLWFKAIYRRKPNRHTCVWTLIDRRA